MEFASSYFYVQCAATTEPSERPRAPLPGEGNNARTGEVPVLPMYQSVEGCGVAMGPVYDQVYEAVGGLGRGVGMEGQGATYMNHSTLSQPLTPSSPVYVDQPGTGLYPPVPSGSYDGSPSATAPQQPAKPTPIPPPRRSRRLTPQVMPPPLPPRPPNMRKVPDYVEVMEPGGSAQSGVPMPLPAPLSPDKGE
ncbi:vegetative cell wall protein gp1-like [Amblyraja radiata]|uniref:vegetative cell wall protein gp1-like n=1 Tax=Amblyraja radiata TaxID=386614 RepID=UPI0014031C53|nr:vegetative cell wall protein gp1-like [Amblyraja radiata]